MAAQMAIMAQWRVQGLSNNQRLLGYTLTDDIDIKGAAFGEAGTYSIGAALGSDMLEAYAGCRVVGIRIAVGVNLGRTRTFLYNYTGEAFDLLIAQNQRLYEGWNIVMFNGDGYEIKGDEMLFYGYDYTETAEMVAAEQGGMSCTGQETDGAFYLYGNYSQGEGLYSISGAGRLCVQLIVDVSNLPRYDMKFTYLDTGFKYKKAGEEVEVLTTYTNTGRDTISTCQLGYQIDDRQPVVTTREHLLPCGDSDTWIFPVKLSDNLAIGKHKLSVFVNQIEGTDVEPTDRRIGREAEFAVYQDSLSRTKVYLEVYAHSASAYTAMFNDAIDNLTNHYGNEVSVANVHYPGSTLAADDADYLWSLYAYVPSSFTVNRAYFPGEAHIAYDMNDYLPVFTPDMCGGILADIVMQDLYSPAFADLTLQGNYNPATRQLDIFATGSLLPEAQAIYGDVALTLMLTEDSVVSRQAVYNPLTQRTAYDNRYVHNHVLRAFITRPKGDAITADDKQFSAHFTTTLDTYWNERHLHVIGLLTKAADTVTDDNVMDMDVINCNSLNLSDIIDTQGIASTADRQQSTTLYTLDGKRVSPAALSHGIYIERRADGTTRKVRR